jgi:TonB family protein
MLRRQHQTHADTTYDMLVRTFGNAEVTKAKIAILEGNREYETDVPVQSGARLADEDGWLITQFRPVALQFQRPISLQAVWIESFTNGKGNSTECLPDAAVPLVPATDERAQQVHEQLESYTRENPLAVAVRLQDGIPFITPDNCTNRYVEADLTRVVSPAERLNPFTAKDADVTVLIRINLQPDGELDSAVMQHSSGNVALDKAALTAAKQARFSPKKVNCIPFAGSYLFRAEFDRDR